MNIFGFIQFWHPRTELSKLLAAGGQICMDLWLEWVLTFYASPWKGSSQPHALWPSWLWLCYLANVTSLLSTHCHGPCFTRSPIVSLSELTQAAGFFLVCSRSTLRSGPCQRQEPGTQKVPNKDFIQSCMHSSTTWLGGLWYPQRQARDLKPRGV